MFYYCYLYIIRVFTLCMLLVGLPLASKEDRRVQETITKLLYDIYKASRKRAINSNHYFPKSLVIDTINLNNFIEEDCLIFWVSLSLMLIFYFLKHRSTLQFLLIFLVIQKIYKEVIRLIYLCWVFSPGDTIYQGRRNQRHLFWITNYNFWTEGKNIWNEFFSCK